MKGCTFLFKPSERVVTVRRKWLQFAGDSSVHLRPEISGHGSTGDDPREEHGRTAPTPNQQVLHRHVLLAWFLTEQKALMFLWLLRILGNRVAELEKKLKTLEMSGLWSLPGKIVLKL